ncbi:hypothetical protein PCE1_001838 [Barthelona sp. PCE]
MSGEKKVIGVHNGSVHVDEVWACALMRILPDYRYCKIFRSRNLADLERCDLVVDVGGKFDGEKYFDHHQKGFNVTYADWSDTKCAAVGLIFKTFKRDICRCALRATSLYYDFEQIDVLADAFYELFIRHIDAADNGISSHQPLYNDASSFRNRIAHQLAFEPVSNHLTVFYHLVETAKMEIYNAFRFIVNNYLPSIKRVKEAYASRFEHHESGKILIVSSDGINGFIGDMALRYIEKDVPDEERVLYLISRSTATNGYKICIIAMSKGLFDLGPMRPFPESWRGMRETNLVRASGMNTLFYCHHSGFLLVPKFIGVNVFENFVETLASKIL